MDAMTYTLDLVTQVGPDHRITIQLPSEVPEGPVRVTYFVEALENATRKLSPEEFLDSEFFGMLADRVDLPGTNEEFIAWRRGLQDRSAG